jgi:hypothetical protein
MDLLLLPLAVPLHIGMAFETIPIKDRATAGLVNIPGFPPASREDDL